MASTPIAVIGLSGRYPGPASTPARLWDVLRDGVDAVGEAPPGRWDDGYYNADHDQPGRFYTRAGGFLPSIDTFDAEFFGMSPREARQVDPQQRLLLELAWEALEDAALVPKKVAGSKTGVFIGISSHDYADLIGPGSPDAYSNTGSSLSISANRVSYVLDLHGPSIAMDTACSSGMVSVHQACRSLIEGACDMAFVGAVNILAHARPWIGFAKASMLSPTGRCKSFDASGDGYVRSEGGGMLLLKKLEDAERDGNNILGVILATGVNSDGRTMGLSMPNKHAQEALLRQVYGEAGIRAEDVFYVEAHGTGTSVGDPIECEAIGKVLGAPREDGSRCHIGSVKSNIGHLEPASGIAGLTKVLLAMRHRTIPAQLHYNTPNPSIDFEGWKLDVVGTALPLPDSETPLIFGINSFGFGGTNAHAIMREYRPTPAAPKSATAAAPTENVLILSAQTDGALADMARDYAEWLRANPAEDFANTCATAALARSRHAIKLALAAGSAEEAAGKLDAFRAGEPTTRLATGKATTDSGRVAFVYSGNGPQWYAMGRELLNASPRFRAEVAKVDALFSAREGWSLIDELHKPEDQSRIGLTEVAQPTLFAIQVGLTALLREAGVAPTAVFGHSVGEAAAAYASGALSLEQATDVIIHRSTMQARTAGMGKMAALGVGPEEALTAMTDVGGFLELAATNSPRAVTVAGDPEALETLRARMTEAGKFARVLPLNYAFHSKAMDPIRDELLTRLDGLAPSAEAVPFISTVEGKTLPGSELGAEYWWRNIRAPVKFAEAVDFATRELGITTFVEIGPHPVLRDYVLQCAKARDVAVAAFATLRRPAANRPESDVDNLWLAICSCHAQGVSQLETVFERPAQAAALPTYPWQRLRHWRGWVPLPDTPSPTEREHPLLGWRPRGTEGIWQNTVDLAMLPYLADHVVQDAVLFPAAGYVEMGLAAAGRLLGDGPMELENFEILKPMVVSARPIPAVQVSVDTADGTIEIRSRPDIHAEGHTTHIRARVTKAEGAAPVALNLEGLRSALPDHIETDEHYLGAKLRGLAYGPAFQGVQGIHMSAEDVLPREALCDIVFPALDATALNGYRSHPAVLDCALQVLISLLGRTEPRSCAYIPTQIEKLRSYAPLTGHVVCHLTVSRESERSGSAEIAICDTDGTVLLTMSGARFRKVDFKGHGPTPLVTEAWRADPTVAPLGEAVALPAPTEIAASLRAEIAKLVDANEREAFYADISPAFDKLVGAYAAEALLDMGAADSPFTMAALQRRGRAHPAQSGLLNRLLGMAEADGLVDRKGANWTWRKDAATHDAKALWKSLFLAHPAHSAELILAARYGERLAATLREAPAEASEKADAATEQLYDGSPFRALATEIAQTAVRALIAKWPAGRPIRVLELGAGTGGLTAAMLPLLPAWRTDYVFSDASQAALDRAGQRFGAYPFLRTALFDASQDRIEQGLTLPDAAFDIVLASEAISAATDGPQALANARALLAPGGWLAVIEPTGSRMETLISRAGIAAPLSLQLVSAEDDGQSDLHAAGYTAFATLDDGAAAGEGSRAQQSVLFAQRPLETVAARPVVASEPARSWLLLAGYSSGDAGFAESVAFNLKRRGQRVTLLTLGGAAGRPFAAVEDMAAARDVGADDIVLLAGLANPGTDDAETMLAHQDLRVLSTLSLVQSIKSAENSYKPTLHFVTHGALAGPTGLGSLDPAQAPLWGFGRVLSNEYPDLAPRMVDLHADLDARSAALLTDELLRTDAEVEVLLTAGQRFVNRMQPTTPTQLAVETASRASAEEKPFRLDLASQGHIDALYTRVLDRMPPAAGQVEVRVLAAGLNFRDVLWAMGMLPEEAVEHGFAGATIGMECSGEVVAVGEGVTKVAVGDHVVAFASSTFSSHVTTTEGAVSKIPAGMTGPEAATIPTTFLTAFYALDHLARLRKGEKVLIHGAAGGVGLAAVQIAKLRGAEVFGTAGSEEKRRVLRLLGVDHVLNSRSLEFADDVMRITGGKGVDVILNSLAGEAITKNLQILKPFGRFLEIGKRDFYANSRIGLRPFRNNLSYFGIDADTLLIERAELAHEVFAEVMGLFAAGKLHPLPFTALPVSRAGEAFRLMQASRHIGKIVLTMRPEAGVPVPAVLSQPTLKADGTYLVTGGLGGFGLATAKWLVERGAGAVALVSRRGPTTDEARDGIAAIEAMGAKVLALSADIGNKADVARVFAEIDAKMPTLRGVVHAAVVLDDGPIAKLDGERLRRVFGPKIVGAWNLHEATIGRPLDYFIMYSSGTTVVGNPGQANYVAANLYLDALAQYRRAHGLPGLAVAWGAIKDVGILARNTGVEEMLQNRTGLGALPAAEALIDLGRLMAVDATRVSVAAFNIQRLGTLLPGTRTPRFLPMASDSVVASLTAASETLASVLEATPDAERRNVVIARLRDHVGRVLGTGAGQVDVERSLSEMGLDSLMAVELAESLEQDIGKPVSVMQLIQAGSVTAISELVLGILGGGDGGETGENVKLAAD